MDRRDLIKGATAAGAGLVVARHLLSERPALAGEPAVPAPKKPRLVFRRAKERGHVNHGWLDTWHTFSFASYYDPAHMGFRALRVINEDWIARGRGFPMHPHQDMEIVTYVLEGALEHKDSLGNGSVIRPGEVQRMTAGTGIRHSEFNPSRKEDVHLLQIWLLPTHRGFKPGYAQKTFQPSALGGRLRLVASRDGRDGSIAYNTDTNLYAAVLAPKQVVTHENAKGRHVWIQVARGRVAVNDAEIAAGDAVRTSDPGSLRIEAREDSEFLLFDLA